jgi:hypothetical protein
MFIGSCVRRTIVAGACAARAIAALSVVEASIVKGA